MQTKVARSEKLLLLIFLGQMEARGGCSLFTDLL